MKSTPALLCATAIAAGAMLIQAAPASSTAMQERNIINMVSADQPRLNRTRPMPTSDNVERGLDHPNEEKLDTRSFVHFVGAKVADKIKKPEQLEVPAVPKDLPSPLTPEHLVGKYRIFNAGDYTLLFEARKDQLWDAIGKAKGHTRVIPWYHFKKGIDAQRKVLQAGRDYKIAEKAHLEVQRTDSLDRVAFKDKDPHPEDPRLGSF